MSAPLAGALLLVAVSGLLRSLMPVAGSGYAATTVRTIQLILHLTAGTLAYIIGYLLVPAGRGDLTELAAKLRRR